MSRLVLSFNAHAITVNLLSINKLFGNTLTLTDSATFDQTDSCTAAGNVGLVKICIGARPGLIPCHEPSGNCVAFGYLLLKSVNQLL